MKRILRLKAELILKLKIIVTDFLNQDQILESLEKLEVLDLSRTQMIPLNRFPTLWSSSIRSPLKKLILKNVQKYDPFHKYYSSMVVLTALICPFGKYLEYIDLSFNDISLVKLESQKVLCMERLTYIDLSHNLILDYEIDISHNLAGFYLYIFAENIIEIHYSYQWHLSGNDDLWEDDFDSDGINDNADNCPVNANAGQEDFDRDGIGDICDTTSGIHICTNYGTCQEYQTCNTCPEQPEEVCDVDLLEKTEE